MVSIFVHVICILLLFIYLFVIRINIEELRSIIKKLFSPEIFERNY